MAKKPAAGFTLVEIVIVLAISSMLATIAFAGQRQLRSRASFDAAVNRLISTVSAAQTEATAGVRKVDGVARGAGNGDSDCGTPSTNKDYVFAGVAWRVDQAGKIQTDYYKASTKDNVACIFDTQDSSLPVAVSVERLSPAPSITDGGRMLYARREDGGLNVCPADDTLADVSNLFIRAACSSGKVELRVIDEDGHKADVEILPSGIARRIPG